MRIAAMLVVACVAALVATELASARAEASCSTTITVGGQRLIVIGTGVGCAEARPIVRGLVGAATIGTIRVGGLTLLKLRSPRAGWKCVTSSPIRAKGAGCSKTGTTTRVVYVNLTAAG